MTDKLDSEARMTIKSPAGRGHSNRAVARLLGVHEHAVRYHLRRQATGATDGRARQAHRAEPYAEAIAHWLEHRDPDGPVNLAALHDWLVAEHGYPDSLRSLQRYHRAHFPQPRIRARRRVETPPGAQAQADWGEYRRVLVGARQMRLSVFSLKLSYSRYPTYIWSSRQDQLARHRVHNEALRRFDGVPAVVRIDNLKTGMARGAGPWGEINPHYRTYARGIGFHVDACLPRQPQAKGKVERGILDLRASFSPYGRHWECQEELQQATDERVARRAQRLLSPATGLTLAESLVLERPRLAPLGRMGRRLAAIHAMPPESRPMDLYAALAEVAR